MLDFKNGMEMAVVKMLDSGQYHIEEMQFDCKVVSWESIARRHS